MAYIKTGLTGGGSGVTLNVTCEEDFLGEILTLSDGTTTLTSIVPSSLSVVFDITESGTWTLTNSLTSESIPFYIETEYSATLSAIPDGKTVTPTDDIQIWLKCASISNKPYTTLAEVLNDEAVLCTLMATDNAVDYLVRSTTWTESNALVPIMTSNTTPSGIVSASSYYNNLDEYNAYRAFDQQDSTRWASASTDITDAWIQYQFPLDTQIGYITIKPAYLNSMLRVKTYSVQISDNGTNWETIVPTKSLSNINTVIITEQAVTPNSQAYFRIANLSSYANSCEVEEIQFYSASIPTSEVAMRYIGASDYASEILLSNSTWFTAIAGSVYKDYVINVSVPTMTSNTTPEGVASTDSIYSSTYEAWKAFDGINNVNYGWCPADSNSHWVQYEFIEPVCIKKILYRGFQYSTSVNAVLCGSNNNTDYTDLLNIPNPSSQTSDIMTAFVEDNTNTKYKTIRVRHVPSNGSGYRFQFYGHKNAGIQTWLRAAGITNKLYTSLSEVLNDTAALSTLMASEDAVDYLVTAKSWITDITSNEAAMTAIGNSNYASNTLLADEDWCNGICNSTYWQSVLNATVPTMTNDTTPEGTVFYSSQDPDWKGYRAFSGHAWVPTYDNAPCWVGYHFTSAVQVVKASIMLDYGQNPTYKIQGSNDGTTYTDLASLSFVSISGQQTKTITFANDTSYEYYRVYSVNAIYGSGGKNAYTGPIQFYGRKDI